MSDEENKESEQIISVVVDTKKKATLLAAMAILSQIVDPDTILKEDEDE